MKYEEKCKVLTAENTAYDFAGNKGVSHKIRLSIEGEVFSVKTTEAQVNEFKDYLGQEGTVQFQLVSPKENLRMNILSFKED